MKRSRLFKHSFLVRLLGLLMVFLFLSAFTAPEKPEFGIYDPDHYLTDETISQIRELNNVNSKKSEKFQMGVYVVKSLDGETIETVANETARAWKIGYSGDNNGVLIVVAVQDRKSRIETSNNVASKITDYQTNRFLKTARPYFKNGDYNKGVLSIVNNLNYMFYSGSSTTASSSKSSYDYATNSSRLREIEKYTAESRSSKRNRKSSSNDGVIVFGVLIYFIVMIIGFLFGARGSRGDDSGGGWWGGDSSDSGSSWSDSGSDSSGGWDGGGFDGGGSSDDW
ncbi:TPM domain-containing protein [Streptococcus sp. CF8-6]|uniref:TPM domain-containing protein n=1 Tax=Streptococcus sp. CF8-6 TaxID=2963150 RepID=UPI0020C88221|nr:TPM domain-containing protein [Streptococcus sp. CF8-6]MCP9017729.1 TPM domain-containing protein [Streptococcus sp. CF8-6]